MATLTLLVDAASLGAVVALFLYLWLAQPSKSDLSAIDEALGLVLGDLRDRMTALDDLVDLLPGLVPGVTLVNQNPLSNIMDFIMAIRGESPGSNSPDTMRDDDGRFIDGSTTEKTTEEESAEARVFD